MLLFLLFRVNYQNLNLIQINLIIHLILNCCNLKKQVWKRILMKQERKLRLFKIKVMLD